VLALSQRLAQRHADRIGITAVCMCVDVSILTRRGNQVAMQDQTGGAACKQGPEPLWARVAVPRGLGWVSYADLRWASGCRERVG